MPWKEILYKWKKPLDKMQQNYPVFWKSNTAFYGVGGRTYFQRENAKANWGWTCRSQCGTFQLVLKCIRRDNGRSAVCRLAEVGVCGAQSQQHRLACLKAHDFDLVQGCFCSHQFFGHHNFSKNIASSSERSLITVPHQNAQKCPQVFDRILWVHQVQNC